MRTIIAAGVLAGILGGCYSPPEPDPQEAYDAIPRREPTPIDHRIEIPRGDHLEYMAMLAEDGWALCPWTSDPAVALAAGRRLQENRPTASWYVIWRQKPTFSSP